MSQSLLAENCRDALSASASCLLSGTCPGHYTSSAPQLHSVLMGKSTKMIVTSADAQLACHAKCEMYTQSG